MTKQLQTDLPQRGLDANAARSPTSKPSGATLARPIFASVTVAARCDRESKLHLVRLGRRHLRLSHLHGGGTT